MQRVIDIFTDGACSSKSKCGGYAVIIVEEDKEIGRFSGRATDTTNNRMELEAFLAGLKVVNEVVTKNTEVNFFCDSAYIVNCFEEQWYLRWQLNGWRASDKKPVKNKDLWEEILHQYKIARSHLTVNIYKIKAHIGLPWNEEADSLAVKERQIMEGEL